MKKKTKAKLILASSSPQRRKLLKKLRIPFEIVPSNVDEGDATKTPGRKVKALVKTLAQKKARWVAKQRAKEGAVVLGADTVVVCKGRIFGKPKDVADAEKILGTLSGNWQSVLTGVCVIDTGTGKETVSYAETKLLFKKLAPETIAKLARKNLDKSGAYSIQKMPDRFIARMKGDLDNVIGLPLRLVRKLLKK